MLSVIASVLLVALVVTVFAAVGHGALPVLERRSIRQWTTADLIRHVASGARIIAEAQERLWELMLADLQPWTRDHGRRQGRGEDEAGDGHHDGAGS